MEFVEACRKVISLDTTPTGGTKPLALWLQKYAEERGLFVELQEEVLNDQEQANIIIRPQGNRPALEFLLQTHLDTVDPGHFGLWTQNDHNPFEAHIIEHKIYGLGAADVKLDFLCKLEALSQFANRNQFRLPPVLVGTFGEELGMVGILKLIRRNKISARAALVGEPSDMRVLNAGQGLIHVEVRIPYSQSEKAYREEHNLSESTSSQSRIFNGKAAHSSMPHLGDSAIRKMFEYLQQLPEGIVIMEIDGGINFNSIPANAFLEIDPVSSIQDPMAKKIAVIYSELLKLEEEFKQHVDETFFPSHPTLNIGLVRTHEDHVLMTGTCRWPPVVTQQIFDRWMERLTKICQEVGAQVQFVDQKKPFRTDAQSMLVRVCREELRAMGLSDAVGTHSSANEASLLSRIGIDCVSFGPGAREGNIHTPHEHVKIDDLHKAIDFYRRIIERFCI